MADPRTVAQLAIGAAIAVVLLSVVFQVGPRPVANETVPLEGTEPVAVDELRAEDERVRSSLGRAARFGPDDNASATVPFDDDGGWGVAAWLRVGDSTRTMSGLSVDTVALGYNSSRDAWEAWYYNVSTRHTQVLRAPAVNEGNLSHLALTRDGGTLTLFVDGSAEATAAVDSGGVEASGIIDRSWVGSVDEARVYNASLSTAVASDLVTDPTLAADPDATAARIYFDRAGEIDSEAIARTDQRLEYSTGVRGAVGKPGVLFAQGTDYQFNASAERQLRPLATSPLADLPRAFVSYERVSTNSGLPWGTLIPAMLGALVLVVVGQQLEIDG